MSLLNEYHGQNAASAALSIADNRASKIALLLVDGETEIAARNARRLSYDILEHIASGDTFNNPALTESLARIAVEVIDKVVDAESSSPAERVKVTYTPAEMHELREISAGLQERRVNYTARCKCGWESDTRRTEVEAEDDHVAHRLAEIPDDDPRSGTG